MGQRIDPALGHQSFDAHDEVLRPSEVNAGHDDLLLLCAFACDDLLRFLSQRLPVLMKAIAVGRFESTHHSSGRRRVAEDGHV